MSKLGVTYRVTKCYCCGHKTRCVGSWKFEHNNKTYYETVYEKNGFWNLEKLVEKFGEDFRESISEGTEVCDVCKSTNIYLTDEIFELE